MLLSVARRKFIKKFFKRKGEGGALNRHTNLASAALRDEFEKINELEK